jgi:hypothetical protein
MWSSVGGKSFTLWIVITLFFVAFGDGHRSKTKLVGKTVTKQLVECNAQTPCPRVAVQVNKVTTTQRAGIGSGDGQDHGGDGQGDGDGRGNVGGGGHDGGNGGH